MPARTTERTLATDDERYERLMDVTRRAAADGYEAVSMRDVARQARVSMTTVYQLFASKDHLIAQAHLRWLESFRDQLVRRPPRGRSALTRVHAYLGQITSAWTDHAEVTMTIQRAMLANDPGVRAVRRAVGDAYREIMTVAIGDADLPDRDGVIETLGHVINSVTYGWVTGTYTAAAARRALERCAHVLLSPERVTPRE